MEDRALTAWHNELIIPQRVEGDNELDFLVNNKGNRVRREARPQVCQSNDFDLTEQECTTLEFYHSAATEFVLHIVETD